MNTDRPKIGDRLPVAKVPIGYKIREDCGCEYTRIKHPKFMREYLETGDDTYLYYMAHKPEKVQEYCPYVYNTKRCAKHQYSRLRGILYEDVTIIRTTYRKK